MTEDTKKQPAIDMNKVKKKLQQQKAEIAHLEKETQSLRDELTKAIGSDTQKEQQEASDDGQKNPTFDESETIEAFYKRDYTPLLLMLFEKPSKAIRNTAIVALLICIPLSIAAGYFSSGYVSYIHNIALDRKISALQEKINLSLEIQTQLAESKLTDSKNTLQSQQVTPAIELQNNNTKTESTGTPLPTKITKAQVISQQVESILQHVKAAERQQGFLDDYASNNTQFIQLYLIVMPYASTDDIYYESYLQAIKELGVSDDIAPKTIEDLLKIDIEFLHATYSGWVVTSKKKANGWRYREEDREFSSFYDGNLGYDTGKWKIISVSDDYEEIPNIFAFHVDRIVKQVTFNNKLTTLELPEYIYYKAYTEDNKNNSIENLFNQKNIEKINGKLKIQAATLDIPFSKITQYGLIEN